MKKIVAKNETETNTALAVRFFVFRIRIFFQYKYMQIMKICARYKKPGLAEGKQANDEQSAP